MKKCKCCGLVGCEKHNEFKHKIIGVKVIKKDEDLAPILREGIDAIPTEKDFNCNECLNGRCINGKHTHWNGKQEKEFKCIQCGYESDEAIDFMRAVDVDLPDILCNDCTEKIVGKPKQEFKSLSEKREGINGEPYYPEEDTKEFIEIIEARISNQLRIHWKWLKNKTPEEVAEFVNNIITKRAGPKLIQG